ncbi:MAG: carbohydrate-binding domain-containing protein [Ruminococcaceae bacterium]|nr:carbohydrate-binding domain-containing protein [Oscillospiraceae bacterium]
MKKTTLLAACVLSLAMLGGCSLEEPRTGGHVSLPVRTEQTTNQTEPLPLSRPALPDLSDPIEINISGDTAEGNGVRKTENGAEIYLPGVYRLHGVSNDFVLTVDLLDDEAPLYLILDEVHVSSSFVSPLYFPRCSDCHIILTENTDNSVSGGAVPNAADVNAAVWTLGNLTVSGGTLTVSGEADNAISSKDEIFLFDAELYLSAPDDGISGRDLLWAENSYICAEVGGDGIKATNLESGKVSLLNCTLELVTGLDGIDGATELCLSGCSASILAGGGHTAAKMKVDDAPRVYDPLKPSYKGLKSTKATYIYSSTLTADCADDCIHSDGELILKNSALSLSSSDDAVHANGVLRLTSCTADIPYCYEGFEGSDVFLNDLTATVRAFDDGVNASASGAEFVFDGGELFMVCAGDGIDSNGSIVIEDGTLLINGPTPDYNSVLDFKLDYGCFVRGGTYVSTGASGMALVPEKTDTAAVLSLTFDRQIPPNVPISVLDENGRLLVCFVPEKAWQNFQFSSPSLTVGQTLTVHLGGSLSQKPENCISPVLPKGNREVYQVKLTSAVTKINLSTSK